MNEFKVGLLALMTMASVVYMSLKVTSNQSGFGEYVTYRTIIDDASGIFPKTPIKVAGINAGRIKTIDLQGNKALITFEVLKKVQVPKGSVLKIKSVGFLGDKYIEIALSNNDERLEEKSFLVSDLGGGMENLVRDAADVLKDVKVIVGSLKNSLAPDGEAPPITTIMNDMKDVLKNMKRATIDLSDLLNDNKKGLSSTIENLNKFTESLNYHLNTGNKDSLISDFKKIGPVLDDMKKMTADLSSIVENIKKGKGTVGQLLVEEEIADSVKQTLASVQKVVGKVDAIRTEIDVFTGGNSEEGSTTSASLKIFPSPERFYTFGMATSDVGATKKKYIRSTINGTTTEEDRLEYNKDTYRFNAQLGRKIHNWSIRGGLIESSGGIGVDYDYQKWGSRFSFEVFDYREGIGPNLRTSAEVQLWNVFYGRVALEDMISDDYRSMSVTAGLRFTDEDLKGLIGFFLMN